MVRSARLAAGVVGLLISACSPAPAGPASPVDGIVTEVNAPSLDRVESFTLRLDSGEELDFTVAPGDPEVTAADLREHRNFAIRLRVFFTRTDSGELLAERAEHFESE